MAFRFWRRVRLAPSVTLNLSKSTASLSFGPRGAKYTISPRGNRATAGLPGTGLFYTVHDRKRSGRGGAAPVPSVPQRDRLKLSFFQRLMTPAGEKRFIDGIRALNEGDQDAALSALEDARDLPDAAWMAGMIRLRREEFERAKAHFRHALNRLADLGALFAKYDIAAQANLPITSDIFAHVFPRERGTRLRARKLKGHIHRKGKRGKPLTEQAKGSNRTKSTVRVRVEHVFGAQTNDMGGTLVRSIGLVRAKARIGMRNLAYNMRRLVQLRRINPCPA